MNNILTGAALGAALTTAGVYAPDIILSQFTLTDFTMLQTFLSAAAGSVLLVTASQTLGLIALPPRPASTLGLLPLSGTLWARYDGNIIGGALLGAGMAISGACPGTVLAQLGVGVRSGRYTFGGAVLGGVAWGWVKKRRAGGGCPNPGTKKEEQLSVAVEREAHKDKEGKEQRRVPLTAYEALGVSRGVFTLVFEAALVLAIAAAMNFTNAGAAQARGLPPYLGGLAIAAAQLVSIVLNESLLGASGGFEELGGWVWGVRRYANVLFSAGLVGGAWLASSMAPALKPVTEVAVSPLRAALGGFFIIFGARMAGGCTSGHGISGLSLMSISSFFTVAATFGVGILTGLLMG